MGYLFNTLSYEWEKRTRDIDIYQYLDNALNFLDFPEGKVGWCYHLMLMLTSFIYICFLLLETADGPNYYDGRSNKALYNFLPYADQYWAIKFALSFPLMLHVYSTITLMGLMTFLNQYHEDADSVEQFKPFFHSIANWMILVWTLYFTIVISVEPEFPDNSLALGIYHIIDFLRYAQIIRSLKSVPEFFVVNQTYKRVIKVVIIPVFIFFCFNLFFGLVFYIVDPCYNEKTCAFENLFQAVFYSIVTMTTTGYGNQTPKYTAGRILAMFVMLCGAPYMAIPISIIDAEFGGAWRDLLAKQTEDEELAKKQGVQGVATKKLVSNENAVLAAPSMVPQGKVNALALYSRITDSVASSRLQVEDTLKLIGDPRKDMYDAIANIVIGVSRLQSQVSHFAGDITSTDDTSDPSKKAKAKKTGDGMRTNLRRNGMVGLNTLAATDSGSELLTEGEDGGSSKSKKESRGSLPRMLEKVQAEAQKHPMRSFVRLSLELPSSSHTAYIYDVVIVICILLSVGLLFWQSVLTFMPHGPSSSLCQAVVKLYCDGPYVNFEEDPGCFVGSTLDSSNPVRLSYHCTESNCFGSRGNFAGVNSSMACLPDDNNPGIVRPFRTQEQLDRLSYFSSFDSFQHNHDICYRRECSDTALIYDASQIWFALEIIINSIYLIDIGLHIFITDSIKDYLTSFGNIIDVLSFLPFVSDIIQLSVTKDFAVFMFVSTAPIFRYTFFTKILKVLRVFKLFRHFPEANIVANVFYRARKDLFWFLAMMFLLASCVGLLLYDVNQSTHCYIGDSDCPTAFVESSLYSSHPHGRRVIIDGLNPAVQPLFYNGLYSVWFALVTMCTVGYGDIFPVYIFQYLISIVLMIAGSFLFAIPISIISRHFSASYAAIATKQKLKQEAMLKLKMGGMVRIDATMARLTQVTNPRSTLQGGQGNHAGLSRKALKLLGVLGDTEFIGSKSTNSKSLAKDIADEYARYALEIEVNLKHLCKLMVAKNAANASWKMVKEKIRSSISFVNLLNKDKHSEHAAQYAGKKPRVTIKRDTMLKVLGGQSGGLGQRTIEDVESGNNVLKPSSLIARQNNPTMILENDNEDDEDEEDEDGNSDDDEPDFDIRLPTLESPTVSAANLNCEASSKELTQRISDETTASRSKSISATGEEMELEMPNPSPEVDFDAYLDSLSADYESPSKTSKALVSDATPPSDLVPVTSDIDIPESLTLPELVDEIVIAKRSLAEESSIPDFEANRISFAPVAPNPVVLTSVDPNENEDFHHKNAQYEELLLKTRGILHSFANLHFDRGDTIREICGVPAVAETANKDVLETLRKQLQVRKTNLHGQQNSARQLLAQKQVFEAMGQRHSQVLTNVVKPIGPMAPRRSAVRLTFSGSSGMGLGFGSSDSSKSVAPDTGALRPQNPRMSVANFKSFSKVRPTEEVDN